MPQMQSFCLYHYIHSTAFLFKLNQIKSNFPWKQGGDRLLRKPQNGSHLLYLFPAWGRYTLGKNWFLLTLRETLSDLATIISCPRDVIHHMKHCPYFIGQWQFLWNIYHRDSSLGIKIYSFEDKCHNMKKSTLWKTNLQIPPISAWLIKRFLLYKNVKCARGHNQSILLHT